MLTIATINASNGINTTEVIENTFGVLHFFQVSESKGKPKRIP
jgi:hypothetical protein